MRQFIVLGFATTSRREQGESVYLGSDRSEALGVTNTHEERFVRKEMFELAKPHKVRHFGPAPEPPPKTEPSLSKGAQDVADEHQLTPEDLASISGSGSGGQIIKTDVERYVAKLVEPEA